jgi:hypothetical protein
MRRLFRVLPLKTFFLYLFASGLAFASQTFYIDAPERGKQYQVTTTARGIALTLSQRWLYQPSVVKMDDGQYIMLFVTCGAPGKKCVVEDQGLYVASSRDGVTFALENQGMPILTNPPGVCDFIAPRPVRQNGVWYVYVQGTENCNVDQSKSNAAIYVAAGDSLTAGGLNWITDPENPGRAKRALHTNPRPGCPGNNDSNAKDECFGSGIGEDHQWFNVTFDEYLGAATNSIMALYNNWNYLPSVVGLSAALTYPNDGSSTAYWYGPSSTMWSADAGSLFPDVMLGGASGMADYGSPAIKFAESCVAGSTRLRPLTYVGYWPDPYPFNGQTGTYRRSRRAKGPLPVAIETITESGDAAVGGSGFRPRVARNPYGFLDPEPESEPKQWRTFLYYTVSPINNSQVETCNGYTASKITVQSLGVSEVVITELPR